MALTNILFLVVVVASFCVFGVTLAYAEYQTRDAGRASGPQAQDATEAEWRKAA